MDNLLNYVGYAFGPVLAYGLVILIKRVRRIHIDLQFDRKHEES